MTMSKETKKQPSFRDLVFDGAYLHLWIMDMFPLCNSLELLDTNNFWLTNLVIAANLANHLHRVNHLVLPHHLSGRLKKGKNN